MHLIDTSAPPEHFRACRRNSLCLLRHSDRDPTRSTQLPAQTATLEREVHADMNFLADDECTAAARRRGTNTSPRSSSQQQFQSLGLEPGGDNGTFLQKTALPDPLPPMIQQRLSKFQDVPRKETWNAIGILRGSHLARRSHPADRASRPSRHRSRKRRRRHESTTAPTTMPPARPPYLRWPTSSPPVRGRSAPSSSPASARKS